MDINAILNFAGGLLAFTAVVITLAMQLWKGTDTRLRPAFLQLFLVLLVLLVLLSAVSARFIWHSPVASSLLFFLYVILLGWEFSRRTGSPSRGEIVILVVNLAVGISFIVNVSW